MPSVSTVRECRPQRSNSCAHVRPSFARAVSFFIVCGSMKLPTRGQSWSVSFFSDIACSWESKGETTLLASVWATEYGVF